MITVGLNSDSTAVLVTFEHDYGRSTFTVPYRQARVIAELLAACAKEVEEETTGEESC